MRIPFQIFMRLIYLHYRKSEVFGGRKNTLIHYMLFIAMMQKL